MKKKNYFAQHKKIYFAHHKCKPACRPASQPVGRMDQNFTGQNGSDWPALSSLIVTMLLFTSSLCQISIESLSNLLSNYHHTTFYIDSMFNHLILFIILPPCHLMLSGL